MGIRCDLACLSGSIRLAIAAIRTRIRCKRCTACHSQGCCQEKGCQFSHFHHVAPVLVVICWITFSNSAFAKKTFTLWLKIPQSQLRLVWNIIKTQKQSDYS
jgi:hypothetical protein